MDDAALSELMIFLRDSVVAITHGGNKGTGFFVARNVVLTCAHVLELSAKPIEVRWHGESKTAKVNRVGNEDNLDLAVLQVDGGWSHPCVLLGAEAALDAPFYAFGYPDGPYREGGDSATFIYEGPSFPGDSSQKSQLYKFKEGEAAPGMSGAPMLNQRLGKVCAVISINRRRDTDLGARGFPISMLQDFYPSLLTLNQGHDAKPEWKGCLQKYAVSAESTAPVSAAATPAKKADLDKKLEENSSRNRSIEEHTASQGRNERHESDVDKYGFYAEELSIETILDNDGSSKVRYHITNLTAKRDPLKGLRFVYESAGGCVGFPELDDDAKQQLFRWAPESESRRQRLRIEEKLESVRKIAGVFLFGYPLRPKDPPISFGWTFTVLNGNALSDWEFDHLYSKKMQVHVDDHDLVSPMEYFARMVWFPTKSLKIRLALPSRISAPARLSVFRCADRVNVPPAEVVRDGVAQSYPDSSSDWVKANVKWQRDRFAERAVQSAGLSKGQGERTFDFNASQLPVGWCYSLDWLLPQQNLGRAFEDLISRSEEVRGRLIEYAAQCAAGTLDDSARQTRQLVSEFDQEIREQYHGKNGTGSFGVSMMTYHKTQRRLVLVEGFINGEPYTLEQRKFWLPFGLGLAGACFRNGLEVLSYVKPEPTTEAADYFLSLTETLENEVLVALPVDCWAFTENTYPVAQSERCRQLIAVITLSSTKRTSELARLRYSGEEARRLRSRCQRLGDEITAPIQPGN